MDAGEDAERDEDLPERAEAERGAALDAFDPFVEARAEIEDGGI